MIMIKFRGVFIYIVTITLIIGGALLDFRNVFADDEATEFMSWGIETMGLDKAISAIKQKGDAEHLLVAVIDTGVNEAVFHEYFPDRNLSGYCVAACESGMVDNMGQGTHIISTIAEGTSDNVDLLMIRVTDSGSFTVTDLIDSINYAISQGADVINISAGNVFDFDDEAYNEEYDMTWGEIYRLVWEIEKETIDEAVDAGAIIVGSIGNDSNNDALYPASYEKVIGVGATNEDLTLTNFSNFNEFVDYVAPGARIEGLNARYGAEGQEMTILDQGTSMAAAHVTAAVADILSFNKNLNFDEVMELLSSKAIDLGETGRDDYFGNGFIDFSEAEFCVDGIECDEYGVFALIIPDEPDDEQEIPIPDTAGDDEVIGSPNTGALTKREAGSVTATVLASWPIYVLVGVGLWWVRKISR